MLITAFRGWNDGGQAASLALGYLVRAWDAERFADIDPENFFDFQVTRPQVTLVEGTTRQIDWPETVFFHASPEGLGRDVVLLLGIEPNIRWRTFTSLIVGLAQDLGVDLVVTLGALLADVPHTRPAPVTGSATSEEMVRGARPPAVALRGPDRHRRDPPRRVREVRDRVREPVGGGAALRLARAEPARRATRSAGASATSSAARSRPRSSRRPARRS